MPLLWTDIRRGCSKLNSETWGLQNPTQALCCEETAKGGVVRHVRLYQNLPRVFLEVLKTSQEVGLIPEIVSEHI